MGRLSVLGLVRVRLGVIAIGTILLVLMAGGAAYAYFTGSGSGTGRATVGTVSISVTLNAGSGLFPGGSTGVTVAVTNTSTSQSLTVTSLVQSGGAIIQTAGKGACDPTVVTFTSTSLPSSPITHGGSANATGTVSMTAAAADGCQGSTFSLPLKATAQTS